LGGIHRGEPALPKQRVQLDHQQAGHLAELAGKGGLPGAARPRITRFMGT